MKHNTHIYIASKAIEFLYESMNNLYTASGRKASTKKRSAFKREAKVLQRMLRHYEEMITEATWAPDDILNDKVLFHTFKLFTERDFPNSEKNAKEIHKKGTKKYYRTSGGGGLPYKVDHLARVISDMVKLRKYNDGFSMQQIMYQLLLISHYVVDAHVPMHCDLRDDPPSAKDKTKPKGKYLKSSMHGKIEKLWEEATTPVAIDEEIIERDRKDDSPDEDELSPYVKYSLSSNDDIKAIKTHVISQRGLLKFMIDICISTKEQSLKLFPIDEPNNWKENLFPKMTKEIYGEAIGNLISIWMWIWCD